MKTKKEILDSAAITKDERMLLSNVLDKAETCLERGYPTNTKFLSMGEHAACEEALRLFGASSYSVFFGGYEDAERGLYMFFPDYMDAETAKGSAPITLLRVRTNKENVLSHRDFLGALMGLRIDRSLIGDIIVNRNGAELLVLEEAADFILMNFSNAGRHPVSVSKEPLDSLILSKACEKEGSGSVSSPRLDSVLALIFRLSRKEAQDRISNGMVFVNNLPCLKPEHNVSENDRITVRGLGRARVGKFTGHSKKGRLFIRFAKSI